MRSSDELLREFVAIRGRRDELRRDRAGLFCERAEVSPDDYADAAAEAKQNPCNIFELPQPTKAEPCWKAARKWANDDRYEPDPERRRFYLDPPPSEWCASCQRRQVVSDAYREAVRQHGGALRGLLRRGRALQATVESSQEGK